MSRVNVESKTEEPLQLESHDNAKRASWKVNSSVLIYSRSDKKWHDGKIVYIISESNSDKTNEWLVVNYKKKKTKKIQRFCKDIKPIPFDHVLSLKKGSKCLIYSAITKLWCEGEIIGIFNDKDGEWLKVKYYDTNEHKICDIQRYSKELQTFKKYLLWTPMLEVSIPEKPWNILETNNLILPPKLSNIININDTEYIVAAYSFDDDGYDEIEDDDEDQMVESNGIYKYNLISNRWSLYISYPNGFFSQNHNISYDAKNEIIYLLNGAGGGGIWRIHIKTKKFERMQSLNVYYGSISYVIDSNKCHIFWGHNNNNHLLYDHDDSNKLDVIHNFEGLSKGMLSFGMIYNKKEECFLLFGGYKGKDLGRSDEIYKYYNNKWEKLEVSMPDKMQSFGCIITENCKHILIFGGSDSEGLSDKIYILDLMTMKWRLSKIVCPFKGIGYNNVVITKSNNIEYVHLLQGFYSHIMAPIHDILAN